MIEQELAQRAILEALDGKIEAARALGELNGPVTAQLYFWDDLAEKYPQVFRSATIEDTALAISKVEEKSNGCFKLTTITPLISKRKGALAVALSHEQGRPITDVSNLYWEVLCSNKPSVIKLPDNAQFYWLTPRDIYATISGERRVFAFEPKGVQYRLLEWFSENAGFTETDELARKLSTTPRTINSAVSNMKKKANDAFGFEGSDFIESSRGEGYRLGNKIRIKKENSTS